MRSACIVSLRKSERERPLGILKRRCEDNIERNLRKTVFGIIDWVRVGAVSYEPSVSYCDEFLDKLTVRPLLKDSAPWWNLLADY
jgi:hypothetical protein